MYTMKKYYKTYLLYRKKRIIDELPWSMSVYNPPTVKIPDLSWVLVTIVSLFQ